MPKVFAALEQEIEDEVDQIAGAPFGERRLQRREVRCAIVIECDHLAVDDAVRKAACCVRDGRKLGGPVESLARAHDSPSRPRRAAACGSRRA